MSDSSQFSTCVVCGQPLAADRLSCSSCGVIGTWQDRIKAELYARGQFKAWAENRVIGQGVWENIAKYSGERLESLRRMAKGGRSIPSDLPLLSAAECWHCRNEVTPGEDNCDHCGAPVNDELSSRLRYLTHTSYAIKVHCDEGRLPLAQAHACMNDAKSRVAALRSNLMKKRVVQAVVVSEEEEPVKQQPSRSASDSQPSQAASAARSYAATQPPTCKQPAAPPEPRRPLLEIILDPRTLQWLLGLGGAVFVIGLVSWLATHHFFENRVVVAVVLGIANTAVLGGGWAVIRFTRYQTAGRAITLLASLVMPLNLWFYHSYGLITLDGHLWVAALACCVLYLASALVLRDHVFVYVFNGGIVMTGLLMLATAGKFWEIASPAVLLAVLGILSIHLERAFPEIEGPFSRRRFGAAFFNSGHVLLAAGLLMVLGSQIAGDWLYRPIFESIYKAFDAGRPEIISATWGKYLALAIVLAGSYAYFYSDIVVRRLGIFVYFAVFTLLWAEMLVIGLITTQVTAEAIIITLAITALAANLVQPKLLSWRDSTAKPAKSGGSIGTAISLVRAGQPLGLFLSTIPVLLGLVLHLRATYQPLNEAWPLPGGGLYAVTWMYVIAMLVTAVSCRVGSHLYRHSLPWLSSTYFFGTAAATLTGLCGLLSVSGIKTWDELAPLMMVVPILYILAARLYRGHTQEKPLTWVAQAATGVMVLAVLAAATHLTPQHVFEPNSGETLNLLLAAFFAEAAIFYALAAVFQKHGFNIYLCTAAACGAAWQLLQYNQVGAEYYTLAFAILGLLLLIGYRLAMLEWTGMADAAFQCANSLMSLSFVAAALITLSRFATQRGTVNISLVILLVVLTVLSLLAAWLVRHASWRRWYIVMAIVEAGLTFIALHILSQLTLWEKLEIFSVVIGLALLAIGHIGWRREDNQHSDLVSFSLLFGSLLVCLPLTIAVLLRRCTPMPTFSTPNELGMFIAGMALLTTGFTLQLRSTTIVGGSTLLVYLLTFLLFINRLENVEIVTIWFMVGGGVIFGTGVLLSVYRDRLLTLPNRVRRREGMFRVLNWR